MLAYHAVGDVAPEHDPDHLVQPPDKLEWQLGTLVQRGYEFVTASEFAPARFARACRWTESAP